MSSLPKLLALTLGYSVLQGREGSGKRSVNDIIFQGRNGTKKIDPSIAVVVLMRKLKASEEKRRKLEEENRRLRKCNAEYKIILNHQLPQENCDPLGATEVVFYKPEPMEEAALELQAVKQEAEEEGAEAVYAVLPAGDTLRIEPAPPTIFRTPATPTTRRGRSNSGEVFKCEICSICLRGFPGWDAYDRHMDTAHADGEQDTCPLCGATTLDLPGHRRTEHAGDLPYVCGVCSVRFTNRWNLQHHLPQHGRHATLSEEQRYGRTYERASATVSDIMLGAPPLLFSCRVCSVRFGSRAALVEHARTHSVARPFVCKACGRRFKHRVSLKIHSQLHWGDNPHVCEVCGAGFADDVHLSTHLKKHEAPQRLLCKECGTAFRHPEALRAHVQEQHEAANHLCAFCGRAFAALHALLVHEACHHS